MITRRLSVMLFVFSFRVTYVLLFVAWCACGGRGVFVSLHPMACQFYDFFIVLSLLSSSRRLCRLSANLTARAYIRVVMLPVCSDRILTCRIKSIRSPAKVGLVVKDLITSPVVSWEGWETPPPAPRLCCHSLLNHRRGKTCLLLW